MLPHSPPQRSLLDVLVIVLVVTEGFIGLDVLLKRKKLREFLITPAVYKGTPMTPLPHPTTGFSFHIIQLVNPNRPGVLVDLLICDQNQFLVAFRRFLPGVGWSRWHYFAKEGQSLPKFIPAGETFEMKGVFISHKDDTTMSCDPYLVLDDIFGVLADPRSSDKRVQQVCLRSVILLCETTRLSIIDENMRQRMLHFLCNDPKIAALLWVYIRSWKKLSNCALDNRSRVMSGNIVPVDPQLMQFVLPCGVTTIEQIIGPHGQLRLILLDKSMYGSLGFGDVEYPANFVDRFPLPEEEDNIMQGLVDDAVLED